MRVRFDDWVFDGGRRQLLRREEPVPVSPKAFDLLGTLIARRPNAVSKTELRERLWPSIVVSEANLPSLVAELRRVLGEVAARPRYLRTVPRFGYAFCGPAQDPDRREGPTPASGPSYRVLWAGREIELGPGENILGRAPEAVVWVDHPSVSRRHARILVSAVGAEIEDLGSKNGTFVQKRRIDATAPLADGEQVLLGSALVVFRAVRPASTETTPGT